MENQILRLITRFSRCLCKFFTIPILSFFVLENICKIYIIFCPSMHLIMDKTVLALIYILNVCQPPQKTNSAHVEIKSRSWWSLYPVNCLVPFGSSSTRSFLFLSFFCTHWLYEKLLSKDDIVALLILRLLLLRHFYAIW